MLQPLQQVQLVVHHLLVAPDVLLQDDLDCHLAILAIRFSDDAVRPCAEYLAEPVQ